MEAKLRLIRWVLLLQFNHEIRDQKGSENVVTDQLSRLIIKENEANTLPIQENFLDEQFFQLRTSEIPWFVDYVNYLVAQVLPKNIAS